MTHVAYTVDPITAAEYQERLARLPNDGPRNEGFYALGLAGEAGEVANKVKKRWRDGRQRVATLDVVDEVGDTIAYAVYLLKELGFTLEQAMRLNIDKLEVRYGLR